MQFHTLTIVGVGLIGGSIGLAAKARSVARHVVGVGRDFAKLYQAHRLGAIDVAKLDLAEAVRDSDLIIFCTPVNRIAEQVRQVARQCAAGAIVTDVGSTKGEIVQAIDDDLLPQATFLGGHPLAGSEKTGVEHAQADLFVDRWTVLTPTANTPDKVVESLSSFWQALGSHVRIMSPESHDTALALTSHLPHLLAAALAGILPDEYRDLTATGFRDTTRVAAGDPEVWTPIFRQNREGVIGAINKLEERLRRFRQALHSDDAAQIDELLTQGKKVRDALGS